MKKAILVVSFGTTYTEAIEKSIEATERSLAESNPECDVFRAFTSSIIISVWKSRGVCIDNVENALCRLAGSGYDEVAIQPTHLIGGIEFDKLCKAAERCKSKFSRVSIGKPLLSSASDIEDVISVLHNIADGKTIVLMGHGTEHSANGIYNVINRRCREMGYDNMLVGTVEAKPDISEVIGQLKKNGVTSVTLMPLMLVAGDHARNDMAGSGSGSWKSQLEAVGITADARITGLGEYAEIRRLYCKHLKNAEVI